MRIRGVLRETPNGNTVSDNTQVDIRKEADDSLIASVETLNGVYSYIMNGCPGQYYVTATYGGETKRMSSKNIGMAGPLNMGAMAGFWRLFSDGYVAGVFSNLAVSAAGALMQVTVAPGFATVQGILYDQYTSINLAISNAAITAGQYRIDRVVVQVVPPGADENAEGFSTVLVKTGTPAVTPTPPALIQTSSLWEYELAQVRVDSGVSAIVASKVTNIAKAATVVIPPGSITSAMLGSDINEYIRAALKLILKAGTNITLTNDETLHTMTIAAGGAGAGGAPKFKDVNFVINNTVGSGVPRTLGSPSVSLTPGNYLIETLTTFTASNNFNNGKFTVTFSGNAAPAIPDDSSRIFRTVGGVPREIVLSGRKLVTVAATTTYTLTATATWYNGDSSYIEDGLVTVIARAY